MRGADQQQSHVFSYLSPEERVRKEKIIRAPSGPWWTKCSNSCRGALTTIEDLSAEIQKHQPGSRIEVRYMRGTLTTETELVLGKKAKLWPRTHLTDAGCPSGRWP
jgi:hypothetical protein